MNESALLNIIGLLLDILGVIGLFIWGLPSKVKRPDDGVRIVADLPRDFTRPEDEKYERYKFWSGASLVVLIAGFICQIWGSLLNLFP